jgi:hypothetical protein
MPVFHRWLRSVLVLSLFALLGPAANASAQSATLQWDPSPDAAGYVVKWGTALGNYPGSADAGNAISFTFPGLTPGQAYFTVVEAYSADGIRSDPSAPLQFIAPAPPVSTGPARDVDKDGRPDIVWQHARDGYVAVWTMAGERLKDSLLTSPGRVPDTAWRIAGAGDFNGDTKPDLVWQHRTQGWLAVWLMDGLTVLESASVTPARVSDPTWEISAIADVNGDGKSDFVWQDRAAGWIAVWLMNGTTLMQSIGLSPERVPDTAWRIVAAADMNGDGKQDLVWHHAKDGYIAAWLMNGTTLIESVLLQPGRVADANWSVVGVADANADGKADLYWRDNSKGYLAIWLMDGLVLKSSLSVQPEREADTNWRIVSVR